MKLLHSLYGERRSVRAPVLKSILSSIGALFFLAGCHSGSLEAPSRGAEGPIVESGNPAALKHYQAFYIPEIKVYSMDNDVLRRVEDREVNNLAHSFREKLIRQLGQRYTPFPQPARNVAKLNIGLSDVSTTYPLFQLYPGVVLPNAYRGGASIEVRVVDSVTDKEVLSFRDTRQGTRQGFFSGLGKWDGVQRAFDEWAQQLDGAISG